MYTHPVGDIIRCHEINFRYYANDTQLFTAFYPKVPGDLNCALANFYNYITKFIMSMMQLNQDKTEFIVFASPMVLKTYSSVPPLMLKTSLFNFFFIIHDQSYYFSLESVNLPAGF